MSTDQTAKPSVGTVASVLPETGQSRVGRVLIDVLPEPALIADRDGNIVAANQGLAALFEADDPARIVGKTVFDLITREQVARSAGGAAPKFGPPVHLLIAGTTLKGNPRTFEIFNVPLVADSGETEQFLGFALDVTEQRRAEGEHALLAAIVESSGDAIVSISLDGKIMSWNQGAENLFGFAAAEAIGQPVTIYIPVEQHERTVSVLEEMKANPGRVVSFEAPNVRKDGSMIETSMTICGIYDRGGKSLGVSAIHRDVTERKRAEHDRNLLAAIVESSDDAIIGATPDFRIATWNRAAQKLTGFTADEVIGRAADILVPPEERERAHTMFASVVEQPGHVLRFEAPIQRKDGSRVEVSAVAFEIRGAGGEIGQSVIMHDVTERRLAEREQAMLAAIVQSSDDAIVGISPEYRVMSWNQGAERLLGASRRPSPASANTLWNGLNPAS
jgi:PAS domain S-box-containing protein